MSNIDEQITRLEDELCDVERMKHSGIRYAEQEVQNVINRYEPVLQRIRDKLFALKAEKAQIEMKDADVTDEEVPGEVEAWAEWAPDIVWNPKDAWLRDSQQRFRTIERFRAALRAAIKADRKARGVGGVITREQFNNAVSSVSGRPYGYRALEIAFATLGITVED